jgi:L-ascorbate metabolism protein UlaG (beta-lactamase superfamily)
MWRIKRLKRIIILLIGTIAAMTVLAGCSPAAELSVTFVDNDCFVIESAGHKILFDPHEMLPQAIRDQMAEGEAPFDEIDLILVTHTHSDHFDRWLVGDLLRQHPAAILASTQQASDDLQASLDDFAVLAERVRVFEPGEGERIEAELGGIDLQVLNLPHGVPITNLGFLFELGGSTLFHPGDVVGTDALNEYELSEEGIDLAFVPYFYMLDPTYRTEDGQNEVLEIIGADRVVPMHYAPDEIMTGYLEDALTSSGQEGIVFREALETAILE